ncbi:hypothetical protein [Variovorax saccharolyticus]|uniref:hypothetical protein n=1 Tax=Variovorax saccharolyticus TaxID=3053516 RepID=UPI0025773098|nr:MULTISPECIES: hypothetical protein [unclassified Variovorax]MDM0019685.1 hypothetical protein [Variovorax sp. J22R187]MDM0027837.1 hypothetical protein [Variovorax sp. J31P216]
MKSSPGARSWMAAGVRHELLTRALPALRHEMAAPVSVMRMSTLLLKRQLAANTAVDTAAWVERMTQIEDQVAALASGVRSLRDWELATHDDGITRSALVAQCASLMRVAFELNGIGLKIDESLAAAEDEPRFAAAAALRYMALGALGYLHDSVPGLGEIRIEAEGDDALRFIAGLGVAAPVEPIAGAHRAPRALAIDPVALQALADGLGYGVVVDGESVRLGLGATMNPV